MKRFMKQLKDQNVFCYVLLIGLTIVLMITILIGYLYNFYYDTIRKDFCTSNEIYLGAIADQHENDVQIMDDIVLQIGILGSVAQFQLEEDPIKGKNLKERLFQYIQVNQFADDIIYAYHKDNFLFDAASSHEKDHFFRLGLLLEKRSGEQLEELVYNPGKHMIILEEQQAQGYLAATYLEKDADVVCFLCPVRPNYVSTLIFVIGSNYYDNLLSCTEDEERENCLVYENKIIVRRGNLEISDEEMLSAFAKCNDGQSKIEISGKQYMIFAEHGGSGFVYYTLQPMTVFFDKMITKQWEIFVLLILSCIPASMILIFLGHKLILRVKSINALLDEEERYSLNRLEEKIHALMGDNRSIREENLTYRRSKFIERFIKSDFADFEELMHASNDVQICVNNRVFVVLLMRADRDEYRKILQLTTEKETVNGYGITMLPKNQTLFVLFGENGEQIVQVTKEIFRIGKDNREFAMSSSSVHQNYKEAAKAYLEANAVLNGCFFIDNSRILFYEEALRAKQRIMLPVSYIQRLRSVIIAADKDRLAGVVLEICERIGEENCSVLAVQFLFMDLIKVLMQDQGSTERELPECVDVLLLSGCSTMQEFNAYLYQICEWMIDEEVLSNTNDLNIVNDAVDFIEKQFADIDLNIAELSRRLGVNQTELGRIFREQLGMNPSDFLAHVRMEHAKEILECTDMLVKQISTAVGYEDDHVFMKRFKKYTGLTPNQYRNSKRGTPLRNG